jgi:hypothetical protein
MKITLLVLAFIAMALLIVAWAIAKSRNANCQTTRCQRRQRAWRKLYLLPLLFSFLPDRRARGGIQFANIGEGTFENGLKSYIPDAATASRYLLYKTGSDADHCAVCGLNDTPLGPSDDLADANNLDLPIAIKLLGAVKGTLRVVTDGTIVNGSRVKCGAAGQATAAVTGDVSFGIAIITSDGSSAAGDPIQIIPAIPQKYAF